jgi:two-component system secretion system response regulator SalR
MNVLLVDDHALFAKSLEIVLRDFPEFEEFNSISQPSGLLRSLERKKPDVILMDINLGRLTEEDGLTMTKQILDKYPEQNIVMLSGYDLPVYRREARRLGAKGFVNKNVDPEELAAILRHVYGGGEYFSSDTVLTEDLTEAEKKVLRLLAEGIKRKEIAAQLYCSERTISNHLQHIFEKLQVSSAVEAVTKGMQLGYLVPDFSRYQ